MHSDEFDRLSGRIEGIARALLHTVAELEMQGVIDGPRLSSLWRDAAPRKIAARTAAAATARTLQELVAALDEARSSRQAQGRR